MLEIVRLTPEFAIGPQLSPEDFEQIRGEGFASILNARPDDELGEYLLAPEASEQAQTHGLAYAHSPTQNHDIFEKDAILGFRQWLLDQQDLPATHFAWEKAFTGEVWKRFTKARAADEQQDALSDRCIADRCIANGCTLLPGGKGRCQC